MPRTEKTREARIERLLSFIRANSEGLKEAEIADAFSLERRTVNNYLRELEQRGQIYREDGLAFPLWLREGRLRPLDISPEEAITLYLAARLYVKQTDRRNEPAESALFKLADSLTSDVGVGEEIRQAALELANRPVDHSRSGVFGEVVRGYLYRRVVEIDYAPRRGKPFRTRLKPYLLEPSTIGYTTYVIGYSSLPDQLRTYKLERIQRAELTGDEYSVPVDFPGLDILRHSWSIMLGEELVEVILRFHPQVVDRVNETRWHPSEQKMPDPDRFGWLRWSAQVTDTIDMLPWIRGWGADVEVLAPAELRDYMIGEAKAMAELYGWSVGKERTIDTGKPDHSRFDDIFGGE